MSIAKCPHCQDEVRVPSVHIESIVRCPLCKEEYSLQQVLRTLPPELIVVEQPGVSGDAIIGSSVVLSRENESAKAEPAAPFEFEDETEKARPAAPPAVVTSRQTRKEKSPAGEMLKIVFGGVVGVAIAQLILWWLPQKWARDPFEFGPTAARYAPWIVPKRFHSDADVGPAANADGPDTDTVDLRKQFMDQIRRDQAKKKEQSPNQTRGGTSKQSKQDTKDDKQQTGKQTAKNPGGKGTSLGVREAPSFPADVVRDAWQRARTANGKWSSEPSNNHRLYVSLSNLAHCITFADVNDEQMPAQGENVRRLLKTISESPKRLTSLTNQLPDWLNDAQRPTEGVFLYGKIKEIKQAGAYYETRVEVYSEPKREVTVISSRDPAAKDLQSDKSVIILGSIVEMPTDNLVNYEGEQSFVVYGGYPLVVQPPPAKIPVDGKKKKKSGNNKEDAKRVSAKKVPVPVVEQPANKSSSSSNNKQSSLQLLQLPLDGRPPAPQPAEKPSQDP